MSSPRGNMRKTAFTLIELLVVIAVLAVLISIVLPAMSAARAEGHKARCLANLRTLLQTAQAYATDDPREVFGPIHYRANWFRGEGYAEYGGGPGTSLYLGWNDPFDPATRPFNRIMYGVNGVVAGTTPGDRALFQSFQCPGEEFGYQNWPGWGGRPNETEQPYFKSNGTAFRMNNLVWSDSLGVFVGGVYGRPLNRIPDTSLVLGFMESRAFQTIWTNDVWGQLPVRGELTSYHRKLGYFNLGYCDGHAAFADMGNGTYYPQALPNGYLDVRGTWGRMDCLPDRSLPDPYNP
jgi:prepilin-type N-terminal cleavage/methylation domain-containing protein/prepilin-type processing-associated H-X9-DG protein